MRGYRFIGLLLVVLLASCRNVPEVEMPLRACASLPAGGRASACACALNGKGYVFGGRDQNGHYLNDLWQYDPATDSWTQMSAFPGKARVKGVMIAEGNALYVGFGAAHARVYEDSCYLHDLWRYTPSNGQWEELSPSPYKNTIDGVPYVVGQKVYILYSAGKSYSDDVIYYDISANRWDSIPYHGHRAESCFAAAGGQCAGRCFFGTGLRKENLKQWYEVDLSADSWTKKASIPGKGRELCAYSATDRYIYLFGGRYFAGERTGGEVFSEYLRYSVEDDQWERCGNMPCGRSENMIAFTIGNKVYFGLGEDEEGNMINKLYCIEE